MTKTKLPLVLVAMKSLLSIFAATILAAPAVAQDAPPLTSKEVKMHLTSGDAVVRHYPQAALMGNLSGHASALCTIGPDGALTECSLAAESPEKVGFGHALLEISKEIRVDPTAKDGSPTPGRKFLFQMNFKIPG